MELEIDAMKIEVGSGTEDQESGAELSTEGERNEMESGTPVEKNDVKPSTEDVKNGVATRMEDEKDSVKTGTEDNKEAVTECKASCATNGTKGKKRKDERCEENTTACSRPSSSKRRVVCRMSLLDTPRLKRRVEHYEWPEPTEPLDHSGVVMIVVDLAKDSEEAFDWCVRCLHRKVQIVIAIHAMNMSLELVNVFAQNDYNAVVDRTLLKRTRVHEKFDKKFRKYKLNGAMVSDEGRTQDLIVEEALRQRPKYIVTGSRRMSPCRRFFHGSVSIDLTQSAPCPVLVYRKPPYPLPLPVAASS